MRKTLLTILLLLISPSLFAQGGGTLPGGGGGGSPAFSTLTASTNSNVGNFQWAQAATFSSAGFFEPYGVSLSTGAGCNPQTLYTAVYVTGTNVDGFYGCVSEPVGSTNQQANGIAGYATSSANSSGRTVANAVGTFGLGHCTGNNCAVWGMNSIVDDLGGVSADNMESMEVDLNIRGSPTYVSALQINGFSFAGAVFPTNASELDILYNGPVLWPNAIHLHTGVTKSIGLWLDGSTSAVTAPSQVEKFTSYNSSSPFNWGNGLDTGGSMHLNGPGFLQTNTFAGSLNTVPPAAPTASFLVATALVSNTTLTSSAFSPTTGFSILVAIESGINGANSITSVTDLAGNYFRRLNSTVVTAADLEWWVSPCIVFPNAADTITVTQGSSNVLGFAVWSVANTNCSQPLAVSTSVQFGNATGTAATVSSLSTTSPNEIVLSAVIAATTTYTQGAGYTLDLGTSGAFGLQHQTFSTTNTATTAPMTIGVSEAWREMAISLQSTPQLGTPLTPWPSITASQYQTGTNCSSGASPAVCGSAAAGSVAVPTGTNATLTVNTTAVTANSLIFVQSDETLGTKLGVTCNSTLASLIVEPVVSARSAGTSFQITISGTTATNPVCLSYFIVN
jgi:hypothetical protein